MTLTEFKKLLMVMYFMGSRIGIILCGVAVLALADNFLMQPPLIGLERSINNILHMSSTDLFLFGIALAIGTAIASALVGSSLPPEDQPTSRQED